MIRLFAAALLLMLAAVPVQAEDGYDLWLRYRPLEAQALARYRPLATAVVAAKATSPTLEAARAELTPRIASDCWTSLWRGAMWPTARW